MLGLQLPMSMSLQHFTDPTCRQSEINIMATTMNKSVRNLTFAIVQLYQSPAKWPG
jgi:hypothetical protein